MWFLCYYFSYFSRLSKDIYLVYMYPPTLYPHNLSRKNIIIEQVSVIAYISQRSVAIVWKWNIMTGKNKSSNWYSHKPENLQADQSQSPTTRFRSRAKQSPYCRLMHAWLMTDWRQNLAASEGNWTACIRLTLKNLMLV